jgi:response regulator of citrate/malate metabolism
MSNELIEFIKNFGLPWGLIIFALIVLARVTRKHVWPFAKSRIDEMVAHWKEQQKELTDARKKSFEEMSGFIKQASAKDSLVLEGLQQLTSEIKAMRQETRKERVELQKNREEGN